MHDDDDESGCPSVVNGDLVEKANKIICENCWFIISELSMCFPQISQTLLYETVADSLDSHEVSARWAPEMLSFFLSFFLSFLPSFLFSFLPSFLPSY
jgi:hypothetical protein